MPVVDVLKCLKNYGQRLDVEIAKELGLPLATVRRELAELAASRQIITCTLTRFEGGKPIETWQCRVSGYVPPAIRCRRIAPEVSQAPLLRDRGCLPRDQEASSRRMSTSIRS